MKNRFPRFEAWLTTAVSGIRFYYDREEVRQELYDHFEDKTFDLMRIYPKISESEAEELALARMGDAEELKDELARIHKPWVGNLWAVSVWLLFLAVFALSLISLFVLKLLYDNYFRWGFYDLVRAFFEMLHLM